MLGVDVDLIIIEGEYQGKDKPLAILEGLVSNLLNFCPNIRLSNDEKLLLSIHVSN